MWRSIKNLVAFIFETEGEAPTRPPAAVVFERCERLPNLFAYHRETLDLNLLVYPTSGRNAHRDAALLLVYGCENILGIEEVNEAYVCRKLGEMRDRAQGAAGASFDAVYSAIVFNAQDITNACVESGFLRRVSTEAGGRLRLAAHARPHVEDMAYDLNESIAV